MKTYEYFCLEPYGNNRYLTITCTESAVLDFIVSEIKKYVPKPIISETKDLSGQATTLEFMFLKNLDNEIFLWVIKWLCHNGWEPFGITANIIGGESSTKYSNLKTGVHYFRKNRTE